MNKKLLNELEALFLKFKITYSSVNGELKYDYVQLQNKCKEFIDEYAKNQLSTKDLDFFNKNKSVIYLVDKTMKNILEEQLKALEQLAILFAQSEKELNKNFQVKRNEMVR